ncbi:structural maintenance of chromosomes 6A [Actinidia rufa]|uniref:Structural maintenance of chromosomes 6A n=1 Tax=Actinidia rufa TaxID=165716 RepID=A0A7J0GWF9_9ERIC|nr:structural maintenance of chromosomes 6A [Actinidia rufa]
MTDSMDFDGPTGPQAGIISKIRLENFMCHSNLEIEFWRLGQFHHWKNGSGKSAILTALCIAFECRAKGTRDWDGDGASRVHSIDYSKNESFKVKLEMNFGQSWQVASLPECGEWQATHLRQVDDLLKSIRNQLVDANEMLDELESSIRPVQKELDELEVKIKNMEHVEEISQKVQLLKKQLAWSWVYDVDKQLLKQSVRPACTLDKPLVATRFVRLAFARFDLATLGGKPPSSSLLQFNKNPWGYKEVLWFPPRSIVGVIADAIGVGWSATVPGGKMEELRDHLTKKKAQIECVMEKTSAVRRMKDELQQSCSVLPIVYAVLGDRIKQQQMAAPRSLLPSSAKSAS